MFNNCWLWVLSFVSPWGRESCVEKLQEEVLVSQNVMSRSLSQDRSNMPACAAERSSHWYPAWNPPDGRVDKQRPLVNLPATWSGFQFGELQWSVEEFPLPPTWPADWSLSSLSILTIGQEWSLQRGHAVLFVVARTISQETILSAKHAITGWKANKQANKPASFCSTIIRVTSWAGVSPLLDQSVISLTWSDYLHLLRLAHAFRLDRHPQHNKSWCLVRPSRAATLCVALWSIISFNPHSIASEEGAIFICVVQVRRQTLRLIGLCNQGHITAGVCI